MGSVTPVVSVLGRLRMSLLKEGDSCGFAQVLVASKLGGGGFAVARMSADDRSTVWALEEVTVNSVGITR